MFKKVLIFGVMAALFSACSDDKAKNNINSNTNSANSNIELKAESNATIESSLNMQDSNATLINTESNATLSKSESSSTLTAMESKNIQENSNKAGNSTANADSTSSENTATNTTSAESLYKKCIACHGAKGEKIAPGSVGGVLIGNLSKDSIIESLKGYRAKTLSKGGTYAVMYLQANNLSDEDIEILGEYIDSFN